MKRIALACMILLAAPLWADDEPYVGNPIEEGSSSDLGMVFRDQKGVVTTPQHVLLWVDDATTHQRLFGPIGVTPGPSVTYKLPPQANQVVTDSNDMEEHRVTVQYRYPAACTPVPNAGSNCDVKVGEMKYLVRNRRVVVGASTPGTYGPTPAPTPTPTTP